MRKRFCDQKKYYFRGNHIGLIRTIQIFQDFDDKMARKDTYHLLFKLYCTCQYISLVELCLSQCIGCDDQFSPLSLKRPRAAGDVVGVERNIRGYLPVILIARWVLIIGTSWRHHQANMKPPWGPTLETMSNIQLKIEHRSPVLACSWHT